MKLKDIMSILDTNNVAKICFLRRGTRHVKAFHGAEHSCTLYGERTMGNNPEIPDDVKGSVCVGRKADT